MLSMIWAQSKNHIIGNNGQIPWHQASDMHHFVKVTLNKPIIAGYKTFQSFGKPLPHRLNMVLTKHHANDVPDNVVTFQSTDQLRLITSLYKGEMVVVGGAHVYQQLMPYADKLYITKILADVNGDTKAPSFDKSKFSLINKSATFPSNDKNDNPYEFIVLKRNK